MAVPQRSTIFAYLDGSQSAPCLVSVEAELRRGGEVDFEKLAEVRVSYDGSGGVRIEIENNVARAVSIEVSP